MGTGVLDDESFFYEPSLQGSIFPGIEKDNRLKLINKYEKIYDDSFIRISTLPYDLIGLLNYIFNNNLSYDQLINLLESPKIKFEGVDGSFYFRKNLIQRDLKLLKIVNGKAKYFN